MILDFEALDRLWERLKARSRRLQAADATDVDTHVAHALVTVLLFGTIGVGLAMMLGGAFGLTPPFERGLTAGIVFGWAFYLAREIHSRWGRWRYKSWDGICDVVVPVWITAPAVFHSLGLLWLLSIGVLLLYYVFRPIGGGR